MIGKRWMVATPLLLMLFGLGVPVLAQDREPEPATTTIAMADDDDEANRSYLRSFLGRESIQDVARIGGVDMEEVRDGLLALEGERLSRAADQARAIEKELGAQDRISLSATTIIIVLLLLVIIIIAA